MSKKHKQYLGDAVYADWDGYHIIITTSDGVYDTNRILLDSQVMEKLIDYHERIRTQNNASRSNPKG